jgi:hypothetical protein
MATIANARSTEQHSDEQDDHDNADNFMHADTADTKANSGSSSNSSTNMYTSTLLSASVRTGVSKWLDAVKFK